MRHVTPVAGYTRQQTVSQLPPSIVGCVLMVNDAFTAASVCLQNHPQCMLQDAGYLFDLLTYSPAATQINYHTSPEAGVPDSPAAHSAGQGCASADITEWSTHCC